MQYLNKSCQQLLVVVTDTPSCNVSSKAVSGHLLKKRKDYAFWRQFNEKPSITPGCPGIGPCSMDVARNVYGLFKLLTICTSTMPPAV